jgi:ferredoxin
VPIFGEPLGRLYVSDRMVPSLLFFVVFFLHMLLPLAIAVGLAVHLLRLSRTRLFPNATLFAALAAGLGLAALLAPAPLDAPARMAEKAAGFTVDAWYLTPLALALRFQSAGLWVALFGTSALAATLPWLLGRRRPPVAYQAVVEPARCHACTQCVQDCPFDAITMVARTDGKRFPSQAAVDPARCVGCGVCAGSCDSEGIGLTWFDTTREENRLAGEIAATRAAGGPGWIAFVAGDIDSGLALFAATRWRERLPRYQVHFVPTASWVRPKFVERLLRDGVQGVLVLRDARAESAARDGNRWVADRLGGGRKPVFRPDRADHRADWRVLDYDPARPAALRQAADAFARGEPATVSGSPRRSPIVVALPGLALAFALAVATVGPSRLRVSNPAPDHPELVFAFKAMGDQIVPGAIDAVADAGKPVHMRGQSTAKPHRSPVTVRLTVDGATEERAYRAKGISQDGPALDEWRRPLSPGPHDVRIELITSPDATPLRWSGQINAQSRRLHVVTFEPWAGFRRE